MMSENESIIKSDDTRMSDSLWITVFILIFLNETICCSGKIALFSILNVYLNESNMQWACTNINIRVSPDI